MSEAKPKEVLEALGRIGEHTLTDCPHCVIDGVVYELIECQASYNTDLIDVSSFGDEAPAAIQGLRQLEVTLRIALNNAVKPPKFIGTGPVPIRVVPGDDGAVTLDFDGVITSITGGIHIATLDIIATGKPRLIVGMS